MLNTELIKQAASEYFSTTEELNAFMEGFEKEASMPAFITNMSSQLGRILSSPKFREEVGKAVAKAGVGVAAGLLGYGVIKGVTGSGNLITNGFLRNKFNSALVQVMENNRVVKGVDPEKAKAYAETIFKFAPHVASDVNLLNSILANAVLGEGIDSTTIKSLVDLEGRYLDNNSTSNLPSFRAG